MPKSEREELLAFSATRGRKTTCAVGQLPEATRDAVNDLIDTLPLEHIAAWLVEKGVGISTSPLLRHRRKKCACE